MAGMKGFYLGLAGIAVVGSGVLWVTNRNSAATVPVGPIPMDAIASAIGMNRGKTCMVARSAM